MSSLPERSGTVWGLDGPTVTVRLHARGGTIIESSQIKEGAARFSPEFWDEIVAEVARLREMRGQ